MRTDYLFRLANKEGGFVLGTGDLSELALGWCTYASRSDVALQRQWRRAEDLDPALDRWVADSNLFETEVSKTLRAVLSAEISPELIPGEAPQSTQAVVGPYDCRISISIGSPATACGPARCCFGLERVGGQIFLRRAAQVAGRISHAVLRNQYKRSAVPNGPKIVSAARYRRAAIGACRATPVRRRG